MTTYFRNPSDPISAGMIWYASDILTTSEMQELESLSAADLVAYAEAVPSWDYLDPGMWDYIAWWYDLDINDFTADDDFDAEGLIAAAKAAERD